MKRIFIFILLIFICSYINPEKWVGQVATYNLIEGSKTADGQVFNPNNMTAACNGFRLGAKVKIINVRTGKQIEVLVTDRIKNDSNYFILLSPKAADELGLPWETSLVVIDAKFSDVNSTEILPISGLVAEGTVDSENLKKFPDINWPNGDKSITKLTQEKNPLDDKTKKPDQKDNVKIDNDTSEKTSVNNKTPEMENGKTPNKIMQNYMLDEDRESKQNPKNESYKIPVEKDKNLDEDKDEKLSPEKEISKIPNEKNKSIDEDKDNLNPKNESIKSPEKDKNLIDKDESGKNTPTEDLAKTPLTKENLLDQDKDTALKPKNENLKYPEKSKTKINEDNDTAKLEKSKYPEKSKTKMSEDTDTAKLEKNKYPEKSKVKINEDSDSAKIEKTKLPEKQKNLINEDNQTAKIEAEKNTGKIEWLAALPKGEIFVRFSATFEKTEGERRLLLFKQVFRNVVGLKENDKYILLIGPVAKKDIDKVLKGLRDFGYKDAYVVQK
jgi:rare lipoprotein A (peptidoglycan hydrolase)